MGQIQAVLCGYYGKGNGGDEALLAALLQMLPDRVTPLVLSGNPEQTRTRYGIKTCDRKSAFAVLEALRQSDAMIWGGGSLMQDATSAISPLYYGGLMGLAQRMGLKTIAWGQGIGPLKRPLTRWLTRKAFSGCTAISVRDRGSAALLADWRIPCSLAPDPVWALDTIPVPELRNLPDPKIAATLRLHPLLTPKRLDNLTQALIELQNAIQASIVLLPFQPAQDLALAEAIQTQLPGPSQILCLDIPQALKGVFQKVEMAIGMRFHSLIMAAAEGCRCFALSYDPKINRLMDELAIPGWDLSNTPGYAPLPTDAKEMVQAWLDCYTQGKPLSPAQIQSRVAQASIHGELLQALLEPAS